MSPWLLTFGVLALPVMAQIREMDLRYTDSGCASCAESLEARLKRIRGVEQVQVDPAKGLISLKLAAQNRAFVEQVRDFIEQGGSKVRSARVVVRGSLRQEVGDWLLDWEGARTPFRINGNGLKPGSVVLEGEIANPRPDSGPLTIEAGKVTPE